MFKWLFKKRINYLSDREQGWDDRINGRSFDIRGSEEYKEGFLEAGFDMNRYPHGHCDGGLD